MKLNNRCSDDVTTSTVTREPSHEVGWVCIDFVYLLHFNTILNAEKFSTMVNELEQG